MSRRVAHIASPSQHTGGYSDQNRAQNVFNTCVGKVFDAHGSYAPMWWLCVGAGLLAAADHLPIEATRIFDDAAPAVAARAADDTAL